MTLTEHDIGKPVVADGETIGLVDDVRHGTAYVDLRPDVSAAVRSRLGWGQLADEASTYPLEPFMIAHVHPDRIRLRETP